MTAKESLYPKDWFDKAQKDIRRVENILKSDEDFEDAGFHLQQAIEKYFKGYLLSKGWKLERTHDLVKLLNLIIVYKPEFEQFRSLCLRVTEYYIEERYPFLLESGLNKEDIENSLDSTKNLISEIMKLS